MLCEGLRLDRVYTPQHLLYEISYYIYSPHQIKIFFYINNMVVIKMCQKLIPDLIYNLLLWNISQ